MSKQYAQRPHSRRLAKVVAFLWRTVHRREAWGENVERRAAEWLEFLKTPSPNFSFRVGLETLTWQFDLLMEEEAVNNYCLRLQMRAFELAPDFSAIAEIRDQMFKAPISHLLGAVVSQAYSVEADEVKIAFSKAEGENLRRQLPEPTADARAIETRVAPEPGNVDIFVLVDGVLIPTMTIPRNLAQSLKGMSRRVEAIGYSKVRLYLRHADKLPDAVEFRWDGPDLLTMRLSTSD